MLIAFTSFLYLNLGNLRLDINKMKSIIGTKDRHISWLIGRRLSPGSFNAREFKDRISHPRFFHIIQTEENQIKVLHRVIFLAHSSNRLTPRHEEYKFVLDTRS